MRPDTDWTELPDHTVRTGGFATIGAVLVLVLLAGGRGPAVTAVAGCVLAATVGFRLGRTRPLQPGGGAASPVPDVLVATRPAGPGSVAVPPPAGDAAIDPAGPLHVRWWRRCGHDRLYVSDASGRSLGWLDRDTGRLQVLDEGDRAAVERAVRRAG